MCKKRSSEKYKWIGAKISIHLLIIAIFFNTQFILPQWIQTNGPGGGNITSIVGNCNYLFAGTYIGGPYFSTNYGQSWTQRSTGISSHGISSLMIDGNDIFAGMIDPSSTSGNGIYISSDNGLTWTQASNGVAGRWVYSLAKVEDKIFAGTNSGIYQSTDHGGLWTSSNNGLPSNVSVYSITSFCNKIFAGTNGGGSNGPGGIYVSSDNGISWKLSNGGLQYKKDIALSISKNYAFFMEKEEIKKSFNYRNKIIASPLMPLRPTVYALKGIGNNLFAGTTEGTYISADTGSTWTLITDGLIYGEYVYSIEAKGCNIFAGTSGGVYVSTNNGKLWTRIVNGLLPNSSVNRLFIIGNNILAGTNGGVYLSTNDGATWTESNKGLACTQINTLAISGNNIFAGTFSPFGIMGIYRSTDLGENWSFTNNGITSRNVDKYYNY
jgi:photosystem II stability/assembly factor-like uncharacterized protein